MDMSNDEGDSEEHGKEKSGSISSESISDNSQVVELEDNDPVLYEYDVCLTEEMSEHFYVLQYPTRPVYRPFPSASCGRFKQNHQILELDYELEENSEHFELQEDQDFEGNSIPKDVLKTLTLRSRHKAQEQEVAKYAIGIVDEKRKRLSLSAVDGIFQMNPDLSKLDKTRSLPGNSVNAQYMNANDKLVPPPNSNDINNGEASLKPIEVFNKRRETEKSQAIRHNSYAYLKEKELAESWIPLRIFDSSSRPALKLLNSMNSSDPPVPVMEISGSKDNELGSQANSNATSTSESYLLSAKEYLDLIAPEQADYFKDNARKALSTELPLGKQIKQLLCSRIMLKFDELVNYAPQAGKNRREALKHLQEYGVLVRGVWVLRSAIFYKNRFGTEEATEEDEKSAALKLIAKLSEAPTELLQYKLEPFPWMKVSDLMLRSCALRDLTLALFCASPEGTIKRQDITKLVKVQTQDLREILTSIAVPNKVMKSWTFKQPEDSKFCKQNAKLLKLENQKWRLRKFRALVALGMSIEEAASHVKATDES